jgi:hypothetical protein
VAKLQLFDMLSPSVVCTINYCTSFASSVCKPNIVVVTPSKTSALFLFKFTYKITCYISSAKWVIMLRGDMERQEYYKSLLLVG